MSDCSSFGVRNPRTGQTDYTFELPDEATLKLIEKELRAGQKQWESGGVQRRLEVLERFRQGMAEQKQALVVALTSDTGRSAESVLEVDSVLGSISRWCQQALELLAPPSRKPSNIPFVDVFPGLSPYVLVGVISPWNFPLLLSMIDTLPALLAGCAVLVKPSEVTPRFIQVVNSIVEGVPELQKVLRFVPGDGRTGGQMVRMVDVVCFTGSVATGRKVAEACATAFIPAFLELGGKDPAIVTETADLERATSAILWGATVNCGQSCQSIERVYVHKHVFERFVAMLVEKAKRVKLAFPLVEDGQLGPIIFERQAEVISEQLEDARAKGAIVHCGGEVMNMGGGLWCLPTVLTNVNHGMKVMTEETFGPVIPVMGYSTPDEAVQLANDSVYGLSGAVFAGTEGEALGLAERMEVGAVSINDAALTAMIHTADKNSFKLSGMGGTRMGPGAIRRFFRRRAFLIKTNTNPDPWWFR